MKNLILISLFSVNIANAQGFMPPFTFGSTATGEITMDDGNIYKGKFTMWALGLKGVTLKLKTESGEKIKGNSDNMSLIKFDAPKTKFGKLLAMANQGNKGSLY